ncbi:hypothetical protein [Poseidonibacter ostreae]|uniref:Uncharacterized protein n=1 Tax=Poseidonibacter ostreae TaxID=2654171 RepID=A0A6L4WWH3_9BACT|nr:hypothetical protein [Poseidonibacter ostreae]KAB7891402.1 hypothetical protein GBG19_00770 [Poseidonibacter ostreae]
MKKILTIVSLIGVFSIGLNANEDMNKKAINQGKALGETLSSLNISMNEKISGCDNKGILFKDKLKEVVITACTKEVVEQAK